MKGSRSQSGITLVETSVAIALLTALTVSSVQYATNRAVQGTFDNAVEQTVAIAKTVESNQHRVTATAVDPATGIYSYEHAGRSAAFRNVDLLNAELGTQFVAETPYGTAYEYRGDGALAEARFLISNTELDRVRRPEWTAVVASGPTDSYVVVRALSDTTRRRSSYMQMVKRNYFLETRR